jgi:hypothetical protein
MPAGFRNQFEQKPGGNRRQLRNRLLAAVAFSLQLVGSSSAQSLWSSNIFAGYSFLGANLYTGQHANMNGWTVSAEKKYLRFFGVVADFSGHYGSAAVPGSCVPGSVHGGSCLVNASLSENYFQGGIRGSYAAKRVRPFAEFLVGAVHISESGAAAANGRNTFCETLAAGLDFRIARRLGWRTDADFVKSGSFYSQQNSVRASTGLVFLF